MSFSAKYEEKLEELTFNSKPLINTLTQLAEDAVSLYAADITTIIVNKLRALPPHNRQPLLYLMDSILKNVQGPFVALFEASIMDVLFHSFDMVRIRRIGESIRLFS